jgi:hypothetical protein
LAVPSFSIASSMPCVPGVSSASPARPRQIDIDQQLGHRCAPGQHHLDPVRQRACSMVEGQMVHRGTGGAVRGDCNGTGALGSGGAGARRLVAPAAKLVAVLRALARRHGSISAGRPSQ